MIHNYLPEGYHNNFGPFEPVLTLEDGDTLNTTTVDSRGRDASMATLASGPNPLTGPFFVRGAEPGDTLAVDILAVRPDRTYGYASNALAAHVVEPSAVADLPVRALTEWHVDSEAWAARLTAPQTALGELVLPLNPMLGCLGVAPRGRQAISSATSAEHGGNMDYRELVPGATVMFPVFEPGALLFVGDGHAVQGDGEIVGMGIEVSMEVTLRVRVIKGMSTRWPRGMNATSIFAMGNARPLEQALQHATAELLRWLDEEYGLDAQAGSILLGQCIRYDIGNVFDPAYTVVARLDRSLLQG
ncbi:MAG: acetamidase/formamidase family protein [Anaerolineae bacterium]